MKWNARAFTNVTFDFEIEAKSEGEVEAKVNKYLKYIQYGKLEKQRISVKVDKGDELTAIFVMENEIEDVYELD